MEAFRYFFIKSILFPPIPSEWRYQTLFLLLSLKEAWFSVEGLRYQAFFHFVLLDGVRETRTSSNFIELNCLQFILMFFFLCFLIPLT